MSTKSKRMHGNAIQSKVVKVHVTRDDIEGSECRRPTKCMIKVAVKRALNLSHGYIHVDATGVSISRNGTYREKAFLPYPALRSMVSFDKKMAVKPFSFTLKFYKTTPVKKYTEEQTAKQMASARRTGNYKKKYNMRSRVIGLAFAGNELIAA